MARKAKQAKQQAKPYVVEVSNLLPGVIEAFEKKLIDHGSSPGAFLRMSIRSYISMRPIYDLQDELLIGKFKGTPLEDVIRIQPTYISWMLENVQGFRITGQACNLLAEILTAEGIPTDDETDPYNLG